MTLDQVTKIAEREFTGMQLRYKAQRMAAFINGYGRGRNDTIQSTLDFLADHYPGSEAAYTQFINDTRN